MSLYNLLHGVDSNARVALAMLDLDPGDAGRFRDCWIQPGGREIHLFTRNGGGNREAYEDVTQALRDREGYVRDFDDPYDTTYATYVFKVPGDYHGLAKRLAPEEPRPSLQEQTDAAVEAVRESAGPDGPLKDEPQDKIDVLIQAVRDAVDAERQELAAR